MSTLLYGYASMRTSDTRDRQRGSERATAPQRPHAPAPQEAPPVLRGPFGAGAFVAYLAALVPAEVLLAHTAIMAFSTKQMSADALKAAKAASPGAQVVAGTVIEIVPWLQIAFVFLLLFAGLLYVLARRGERQHWAGSDYLGLFVGPLAFLAWTMIQRSTIFDAVFPQLDYAVRAVIAVLITLTLLALVFVQRCAASET